MLEKVNIKGEWFLPNAPDVCVYGELAFDPQEGTSLELYGSLEGDNFFSEFKNQEIVLGQASNGKQITLYGCYMMKSGGATVVRGRLSNKPTTLYSIKYLLIGLHAGTAEELKFNQISAEIFNLEEWIGISGFKSNSWKDSLQKFKNFEIDVSYKLPDPIEFEIDKNTKGVFNFTAKRSPFYLYEKTVSINQKTEYQVIPDSPKKIDELIEYIVKFQNFLSLALYRSTYPLSISLINKQHKNTDDIDHYKEVVKLYFSSKNSKFKGESKIDREMVFGYREIKKKFPAIIKKWYSKYELLEPAFDLVFEQFYNGNRFTVNTFLNLAQSAETFHARVYDHPRMPKEDYKKMTDYLLGIVPEEYKLWLQEQVNFGNYLNLHTRLTELVRKYSNKILNKIFGNKDKFIRDVKNSRNYYTHYSEEGKKKALKSAELFYLSEKIKILLVCAFLTEVGFQRTEMCAMLEDVKYKLFPHLAEWSVLTVEDLESYTEEIRGIFQFYFSERYTLDASYHIGKELTYVAYKVVSIENFSLDLQSSDKPIETYLEESGIERHIIEEAIQNHQKAKLYEEDTFWIVRPTHPDNWTTEKAKEDAREEIGTMLQKLPSYNNAETE